MDAGNRGLGRRQYDRHLAYLALAGRHNADPTPPTVSERSRRKLTELRATGLAHEVRSGPRRTTEQEPQDGRVANEGASQAAIMTTGHGARHRPGPPLARPRVASPRSSEAATGLEVQRRRARRHQPVRGGGRGGRQRMSGGEVIPRQWRVKASPVISRGFGQVLLGRRGRCPRPSPPRRPGNRRSLGGRRGTALVHRWGEPGSTRGPHPR